MYVGDRVAVGQRTGTVMYVGPADFAKEGQTVVGLALDNRRSQSQNDGKVDERRYFRCKPGHALFVGPEDVEIIAAPEGGGPRCSPRPMLSRPPFRLLTAPTCLPICRSWLRLPPSPLPGDGAPEARGLQRAQGGASANSRHPRGIPGPNCHPPPVLLLSASLEANGVLACCQTCGRMSAQPQTANGSRDPLHAPPTSLLPARDCR